MESNSISYFENAGVRKSNLLKKSPFAYYLKAMIAGAYISFAGVVCMIVGNYFYPMMGMAVVPIIALLFSVALLLIVYGEGELFTSNCMYMTISCYGKKTKFMDLVKILTMCYLFNLIGEVIFAAMFSLTGIFSHNTAEHFINIFVAKKMHYSGLNIFFKAIFCNWLVCLAIYIPARVKGDSAKIIMTILIVFAFFVSGYEHSIANIGLFSLALFSPHPDTVSLAGAVHNLIYSTAGNIVGGSVFVGMVFAYLSKKTEEH